MRRMTDELITVGTPSPVELWARLTLLWSTGYDILEISGYFGCFLYSICSILSERKNLVFGGRSYYTIDTKELRSWSKI